VDSNLVRASVKRNEMSAADLKGYEETESNFHKSLDAVITCSNNDKETLSKMNEGKLIIDVIPNGVKIPETIFNKDISADNPEYILFCGSLWSIPNAEGLYWFCEKIWPLVTKELPALKLWVVGIGELSEKYNSIKNIANVVFAGTVPDVKAYYENSAIAVVPLLTGSGTRLKILEAMGIGVPVISTSIGAEGIDYTRGENILIADQEEDFARQIIQLLQNKKQRQKMAVAARELVKSQYDWNIIGNRLKEFLEGSNYFIQTRILHQ
jgi:glycosyltransferase involved in cell wall biosynthesis